MTIVWTTISVFLYAELVIIALLLLPIVSPQHWKQIFSFAPFRLIGSHGTFYFRAVVLLLLFFFLESVREAYKFHEMHDQAEKASVHHEVDLEHINMRLFHAQRNLYISGFAIFCFFTLNRLVKLTNELAHAEAQSAASLSQARNASEMAKALLDSKDTEATVADSDKQQGDSELAREIAELKAALKKTRADCEAMRSQSAGVNKEYDRLRVEHEKLQSELEQKKHETTAESDSKKDK